MINRENWKLSKQYLEYRRTIDQLSQGSLDLEKIYIRHLLIWADTVPFSSAPSISPTFQKYILSARLDAKVVQLSATTIKKRLATARRFFTWLRDKKPGYSQITPIWIKSLIMRRLPEPPPKRDAVTFEEIIAISKAPTETIQERRIRASAVFWYLSGIRIEAFISLTLKAVDIKSGIVYQHPSLGVKTKNGKHATTYLLPIPELIEIVKSWDKEINEVLTDDGYWFAHLSPRSGKLDPTKTQIGDHRMNLARRNLKEWMEKVGLPYKNPHTFRHGHIQWGMKHADDLTAFKAVSENVMHSSLSITDKVYSNLKEAELKDQISSLNGSNDEYKINSSELERIVRVVTQELQKGQI